MTPADSCRKVPETFIMNYICRQLCCGELVLVPMNLRVLSRPAVSRAGMALQGRRRRVTLHPCPGFLMKDHCIAVPIEARTGKGLKLILSNSPILHFEKPRHSGEVSCPRSHSTFLATPGLETRIPDPRLAHLAVGS